MKWPAFDYARPTTLDEMFAVRAAAGGEARILAGGQSLLASLAFRLSQPSTLIDITNLSALKGVRIVDGGVEIGALTRHVEIGKDLTIARHAPLLAQAVPLIAHAAIRNRGTLGGSLALADPAAEFPACALALEAGIIAASPRGERTIPAAEFFLGLFETALAEDEIIRAVQVASPASTARFAIQELTRRSGDYAMAGLAAAAEVAGGTITALRLVFFGLGETPVFAAAASAALIGTDGGADSLQAATTALADDLDPPEDLNGSSAMKLHLARVLTRRVVGSLISNPGAAA